MTFSLFRIPIRVHLVFLFTALILWNQQEQWATLPIWTAIVFLGVLVHELGHAFVGRAFGLKPEIELVFLGGVTRFSAGRRLTPGKSILVSLAGPMVGIVIGGIALGVLLTRGEGASPMLRYTLNSLVFVNLGWGVLNLLPILPLDGGNIMASFFSIFQRERGRIYARYASFVVIALVGALAVYAKQYFAVMLLFLFVAQNVQALKVERALLRGEVPDELGGPLASAALAIRRGDATRTLEIAKDLMTEAETDEEQEEAFHLLAWGHVLNHDPDAANAALAQLRTREPDDPLLVELALQEDRFDDAIAILEPAVRQVRDAQSELPLPVDVAYIRAVQGGAMWDRLELFEGDPRMAWRFAFAALAIDATDRADGLAAHAESLTGEDDARAVAFATARTQTRSGDASGTLRQS